jgi:hypothetical protein
MDNMEDIKRVDPKHIIAILVQISVRYHQMLQIDDFALITWAVRTISKRSKWRRRREKDKKGAKTRTCQPRNC